MFFCVLGCELSRVCSVMGATKSVPRARGTQSCSAVLTHILLADKTEDDADREAQLLEMRLTLTEERNAVMVPSAGSGIPGAPAEW